MIELHFEVDIGSNKYQKLFKKIYKITNKILNIKDKRIVEVSFVSKNEIRKINNQFRKKDKITDVISFAFDDSLASQHILGEIFICYDQAIKQANELNHSIKREVCFLFTHGLLHLYGYDHLTKQEEKEMFNIQEKILEKCKIYRER